MFVYYKCYFLIELTFLKELMLIRQTDKKSAIFFSIDIFINKGFKFQQNICNRCHYLLMMSMNLSNIAFLNVKDTGYRCINCGISKFEAINLLRNISLT